MKPIYFPFTYVPQWVAETLAGCFGQFTVYQPSGRKLPSEMRPWVDANVMEVRSLVQMEDEALENITKEFWAFAGLHDDSKNFKTAVFRERQGEIPCFNESAASRIVADVKNHSRSTPAEKDPHPLFSAQVFLHFAQELHWKERRKIAYWLSGVKETKNYFDVFLDTSGIMFYLAIKCVLILNWLVFSESE